MYIRLKHNFVLKYINKALFTYLKIKLLCFGLTLLWVQFVYDYSLLVWLKVKKEAVYISETLVSTQTTATYCNLKYHNLKLLQRWKCSNLWSGYLIARLQVSVSMRVLMSHDMSSLRPVICCVHMWLNEWRRVMGALLNGY